MGLPAASEDLAQAREDLDHHGLCCLPGVLTPAQLDRARSACYRAAAQDRSASEPCPDFPLDTNAANQRVWNLLARDPIFTALAEHPSALALVRHVLGWPALLSNISGNIAGPGTTPGVLHADQIFVPEPWPPRPQGINVAWCLDDFTAANGATELVPGSHRLNRLPGADDTPDPVPLTAAAGSMLVFDSRVWHRTGANRTTSHRRAGVFAFYTKPVYRTQENWFLTLDEDFLRNASADLLTLLAYRSEGFGLVYGRSPR